MQQIIGSQPKRAVEGAVRCVLHDAMGKEADHHTGDDFVLMAGEEEQPVVTPAEKPAARRAAAGKAGA